MYPFASPLQLFIAFHLMFPIFFMNQRQKLYKNSCRLAINLATFINIEKCNHFAVAEQFKKINFYACRHCQHFECQMQMK